MIKFKDMKRRIPFIVIIAILVLTNGAVWLYAQQQKPPLKWFGKVEAIVLPNTTTNVVVSFRTSVNLNNVSVVPNSGIKDIVSANPTTFPTIQANKDYQLTLVIKSGSSGLKYSGTIHLKDALGIATTAMPLSVMVVVHNQPVPPDPGEAGKQTLEGIDSDNDGVRDDIQRWIVINYFDSEKRRAALTQYAKTNQAFLIDTNDKELSRLHANDRERAAVCSFYIFGMSEVGVRAAMKAILEMKAQFLNTEERSNAFVRADSQLSGTFGLVIQDNEYKAQCAFDPDSMAN